MAFPEVEALNLIPLTTLSISSSNHITRRKEEATITIIMAATKRSSTNSTNSNLYRPIMQCKEQAHREPIQAVSGDTQVGKNYKKKKENKQITTSCFQVASSKTQKDATSREMTNKTSTNIRSKTLDRCNSRCTQSKRCNFRAINSKTKFQANNTNEDQRQAAETTELQNSQTMIELLSMLMAIG